MNSTVDIISFRDKIAKFDGSSTDIPQVQQRILALYSAAIACKDEPSLSAVIELGNSYHVTRDWYYEIILQSYLFLGFPRMLQAAAHLDSVFPQEKTSDAFKPVSASETAEWYERGVQLCQKVYRNNYERLKTRVESFAPEIFRWMIFEGYGKVLSRYGLEIKTRELAIVSCLTIENMEPQLLSHIKGALHVGVSNSMVVQVIEDIGSSAGDGYITAKNILRKLGMI